MGVLNHGLMKAISGAIEAGLDEPAIALTLAEYVATLTSFEPESPEAAERAFDAAFQHARRIFIAGLAYEAACGRFAQGASR
jgi:hypothetical protein